jgi:hypothetical protein
LTNAAHRERRIGHGLLVAAWIAALLLGSNLFQVSSWMLGDIAYHRGVAYTMGAGSLQGEGPYPGLLSYYGGLYPLLLGFGAALSGATFDTVLSVASWGFALLWPGALWLLSRRVWPNDFLAQGAFVLLGTIAAPFTHRVLIWTDSVLASAQNAFPLYPRDVALLLVVLLGAAALSPDRRVRVVGSAVVLAGIVLVHLQIGLLAAWLLAVWAAWRARREGLAGPLRELATIAVVAAVLSAWWWVPRLLAAIASGGVLLGGFPGSAELRLGVDNAIMAFGVVGLLALLGLGVLAARRPLPGGLAPFLVWIAAFGPLIAIDRAVGGFDLLSERRVWLLVSIPVTVMAASVLILIVRRLSPAWGALAIVALIVAPALPATAATARLVDGAWQPGRAGGRTFDAATWDPLFAELNRRVRQEGHYVVASYDAYETWIWSFSGAQVPSLWLPGPFKLGFDPAALTGTGHTARVQAQTQAFQAGLGGICGLARRFAADAILLDAEDGLIGLHDISPAAPYRVDARERSEATISRETSPGTTYRDLGSLDVLALEPGTTWSPGWVVPEARLVAIEIAIPDPPPGSPIPAPPDAPAVRVTYGGRLVDLGTRLGPGFHRLTLPVDEGLPTDLTVEALLPINLIRFTAFSPLPSVEPADGPVIMSTQAWCGSP